MRHLTAVTDRLVGEHPDTGHPESAGDQQEVPAPRVHLERSPERSEEVDAITRSETGEPFGATADDPEMDRDDPGRGIGRVDREWAAQHHPGEIAGPDVDELAGAASRGDVGRVVRLKPLARQDLAMLDQLGRSQPDRHAVGRSSLASPSSASSSSSASISPPSSPSPSAAAPASSGATDGYPSAIASARSPKTSVGS